MSNIIRQKKWIKNGRKHIGYRDVCLDCLETLSEEHVGCEPYLAMGHHLIEPHNCYKKKIIGVSNQKSHKAKK